MFPQGLFLVAVYTLPDPGFAGIWPLMATAPLSFPAIAMTPGADTVPEWLSTLVFVGDSALSGLVNAVLPGRLAHRLRSRRSVRSPEADAGPQVRQEGTRTAEGARSR